MIESPPQVLMHVVCCGLRLCLLVCEFVQLMPHIYLLLFTEVLYIFFFSLCEVYHHCSEIADKFFASRWPFIFFFLSSPFLYLVLELIICKAQYTSCMYTITAMVKLGCQVQVLLLFSEIWASAVFLVFRMDIVVFENIVLTHPCSNCQGNTACSLSFLPIKCPHGHLHGLALHRRMDCCEI